MSDQSEIVDDTSSPFERLQDLYRRQTEIREEKAKVLGEIKEFFVKNKGAHFMISAYSNIAGMRTGEGDNATWTYVSTRSFHDDSPPKAFEPRELIVGEVVNGVSSPGEAVELSYPGQSESRHLLVRLGNIVSVEPVPAEAPAIT